MDNIHSQQQQQHIKIVLSEKQALLHPAVQRWLRLQGQKYIKPTKRISL